MSKETKLYLITLEIDPLEVGGEYNPLPSHLTLVSRFWSEQTHEHLHAVLLSIFQHTKNIPLEFIGSGVIGPKKTDVHLVSKSSQLSRLHTELVDRLEFAGVKFTQPEFIRDSWKPHVSKRIGREFNLNETLECTKGHLIEITQDHSGDIRHIRDSLPFNP